MPREIVYQFKTHLNHTLQRSGHIDKVRDAVNINLVGTKHVNIPDPKNNYNLIPNPVVEAHPNAMALKEAHWHINASIDFPVLIRVYNDGTRDCIPCDDFEEEE